MEPNISTKSSNQSVVKQNAKKNVNFYEDCLLILQDKCIIIS